MSKSEDINTLFRRFGGNAETYQEIVSADHAKAAEQHWPILGLIKPLSHAEAPAARRTSPAGERMNQVEVVIYKSVPQVVYVPAEPVAPAPAEVAVTELAQPVAAIEPVVTSPAPAIVESPVASVPLVTVAAPTPTPEPAAVAAAVTVVPPGSADSKTDLRRMFDRMRPAAPEPEPPVAVSPLKRLIKW